MPELKRVFSAAKMNKDMDERVVPNGQYRDANNIEIATSEGSNVGTVQSLLGNTNKNTLFTYENSSAIVLGAGGTVSSKYGPHTKSTVVASIAHPSTDKIYSFVSAGDSNDSTNLFGTIDNGATDFTHNSAKDYIIEYDTVAKSNKYVFVDIFRVHAEVDASGSGVATGNTFHITTQAIDSAGNQNCEIRPGMFITTSATTVQTTEADNLVVTDVSFDTAGGLNRWKVTTNKAHGLDDDDVITFNGNRVLNFSKNRLITAVNIIDDFIYWTDNFSEPKKINISRSIAGTGGVVNLIAGDVTATFEDQNLDIFHTRLVKDKSSYTDESSRYRVVTNAAETHPVYVDESHVTVIRKAPTQPLEIDMYRTSSARVNSAGVENSTNGVIPDFAFTNSTGGSIQAGDPVTLTFQDDVDYRATTKDIILVALADTSLSPNSFTEHNIRIEITGSNVTNPNFLDNSEFTGIVLSADAGLTTSAVTWYTKLEDKRPMFENRFPRFSYRYKYQDGEYSPFAPFSQIAFLPDHYDYLAKKGYNLGMVNQLRGLILKYYHYNEETFPQDVVEIDLLYKEAGKPAVYTVKTIKQSDGQDEWPDFSDETLGAKRGEFEITTDMIHAIVPSNQIIRPFDNVPRQAKAQEITANRLIYGNYLQNYTVLEDPIINVGVDAQGLTDGGYEYAQPSVKTMRKYQVGVVFSDTYGRETPVLTTKQAAITVLKDNSDTKNRLTCQINPSTPSIPEWAEYFSYYVKETSVEYYTMAMDRWYAAADGNIWLSFPSSERNKLDNETFIVLKKAHGTDEAVKDKARYRILAIENEAPDFVKTERKSLGTVFDGGNDVIGAGNDGYPLQDNTVIKISEWDFENAYGDQIHILTPDSLVVKFRGQGQVSNEFEVSRISKLTDDGPYKIQLVSGIDESAAFISPDDTYENGITDLSMELIELEVENRPEFDGRFFVKILKDATLERYVLNTAITDVDVVQTYNVGYIANNAYKNTDINTGEIPTVPKHTTSSSLFNYGDNQDDNFADQGFTPNGASGAVHVSQSPQLQPITGYNHTAGTRFVAASPIHPTEYAHHTGGTDIGGQGQNIYWWGHEDNVPGTSPWNSASNEVGGLQTRILDQNPMYALSDGTQTNEFYDDGDAQEYWAFVRKEFRFFIDAATAYSWTGKTGDGSGQNQDDDKPGIKGSLGYTFGNTNDHFWHGTQGGMAEDQDDGYSGLYANASNVKKNMGQPSRGIWGGGRYMDISWSGMGNSSGYGGKYVWDGDGNFQGSGDGVVSPFWHQLQDVMVDAQDDMVLYDKAKDFINTLTQPNTSFRFQKDPGNVVYTVSGEPFPVAVGGNIENDGFNNTSVFENGSNPQQGAWGIRNCRMTSGNGLNKDKDQYHVDNMRQRWTIVVDPPIGSVGPYYYSPTTGTGGYEMDLDPDSPTYQTYIGNGPVPGEDDYKRAIRHDNSNFDTIEIVQVTSEASNRGTFTQKPGVWETEPKESVDLDIYYQASGLIPLHLNSQTIEELTPLGSTFKIGSDTHTVTAATNQTVTFTPAIGSTSISDDESILFTKRDHYSFTAVANGAVATGNTTLTLHGGPNTFFNNNKLFSQTHYLDWNNCYCFGNGIESDRIRDDFNTAQIDNGVKASSVLAEQVREERRKHGLIWSGIYNSTAGVNNTNQFIAGEAITKDLNPIYGSIQRLFNRDTRLVMFCEDKILRAVTNKDALYNADGKPQLVSSNTVIGDVTPYQGDFGISKNPESLASTPTTIYFSDAMRGKVLALSGEGVRPISDIGMKDYFSDLMSSYVDTCLGTYDERKKEYNLSVYKKYANHQSTHHDQATISYSEQASGWTSFKSFYPQSGVSLNNAYYTFSGGGIYEHHTNNAYNTFYGSNTSADNSSITVLFNDQPETVKSFMTLNYEGSQANIPVFTDVDNQDYFTGDYSTNSGVVDTDNVTDGEYYNLAAKNGWYVDNLTTNLQTCGNVFFKNKEDKYFGYPSGEVTALSNLDEREFSVQGIGLANIQHNDSGTADVITITVANNSDTTFDTSTVLATEQSKFTVASNTLNVNASTTIGSSVYVDLTISPIVNGSYSGYPLSAADFEIEDAAASGLEFTVDGDTHVNDLADIDKIVFSDSTFGAGDPLNTVNARVHFDAAQSWPADNFTYVVDIDIKSTANTYRERNACVRTQHDVLSGSTVAFTNITSPNTISKTTEFNLSHNITKHSGVVQDGTETMIAELTFASDTSTAPIYYYSTSGNSFPSISFENLGLYSSSYDGQITDLVYTGGALTGFKAKVFYSPPEENGLFQDPSDICVLGHKAIVNHQVKQNHTSTPDDIKSVTYTSNYGSKASKAYVKVHGASGASYRVFLQETTSTTNPTVAKYYNFEKGIFETTSSYKEATFGSSGIITHEVDLPSTTSRTRYDIRVEAVSSAVSGNAPVVASRVPTAPGQASIIKQGIKKLTIQASPTTTSNWGTTTTQVIYRPGNYEGSYGEKTRQGEDVFTRGGNNSVLSKKITVLNRKNKFKTGMVLMTKFAGNDVPQNTVITSIRRQEITLSNAVSLPNNSKLTFSFKHAGLVPFSITAPPASGKKLYLKNNSDIDFKGSTTGLGGVLQARVTSAVSSATLVPLDNTRGIEALMQVEGEGIIRTDGDSVFAAIKSVDSATQITLNNPQTISKDTILTFTNTEDFTSFSSDVNESSNSGAVRVKHIQASIVSGSLVVSGYLDVRGLNKTAGSLDIFIDDFVNVN